MKKQKIAKYLKTGILFYGMILALTSCQKEDNYFVNTPSVNLEKAKKMYTAQFNRTAFPNLKSPPIWEEAKANYNDEGSFYLEIPFQNINQRDIEKSTSYSFDKLIIDFKNNDIDFSITHFYGIDIKRNPVNFRNITTKEFYNFSGIVTTYDLNKNAIDSKFYKNGKDTYSKISMHKGSTKNELLLSKVDENNDEEVTIFIEYTCVRGCFTISNTQGEVEQYYGCSPWECSITSYTVVGGGGSGGTISSTSYTTVENVDHIDDSNLTDPKIKCLNAHLNSTGNSFVKNILKNFEGETDVDIKIESTDIVYNNEGDEVSGLTRGIRDGVITIEISESKASTRASLEVVRTLIHEYIHADIYRKVYEDSDLHKDPVFKETYDKYKEAKFAPSQHHSTMADLYINQIRDALKSYHKNVLTDSFNYITNNGTDPLPDLFYEGLAWRGLKDQNVNAWKEKGNDTIAINNAVNNNYSKLSTTYCPNN